MIRNSTQFNVSVIMCLLSATCAMATTITGKFDITGTAGVSSNTIDFYNGAPSCASGPNVGVAGCFLVGATTPASSFTVDAGTIGLINDLQNGPVTGPTLIPGFMTFSNGIIFDITNILGSPNPYCSTVDTTQGGVACAPGPGPSPFTLTNGPGPLPGGKGVAQSVGIQFSIFARGYTGGASTGSTPYVGIFTTQIAAQDAQDILNQLASNSGTGFFTHAYSASFSPRTTTDTFTPEPGSFTLLVSGLSLFAAPLVKRLRRA